ncbi:MAG: M48 family metallopeptidase [Candidatus Obscuribacterales bacterium]|nr:M48 family metallopeptidase [Candidatus Obscuribacterales bacterium]
MKQLEIQFPKSPQPRRQAEAPAPAAKASYLTFMTEYVRQVNEDTLRVTIGGVRIGSAKYSRLAQINLHTRIITFSRYAIENVPERGRRYLVLHELAHVKEPTHNKRFWNIVAQFEPDYKRVGSELEKAFHANVLEEMRRQKSGNKATPPLIWTPRLDHAEELDFDYNKFGGSHDLDCSWDSVDDLDGGIITGGWDEE